MMMDWFRSHHGAPTDPKWRTIAKRAGVAPGVVVSLAWALLDIASQAGDRGSVSGADPETLADFMGYEVEDVERVIAAMIDKGVLAGGRWSAWERRQVKREDAAAAERKATQRERERQAKEEATRQAAAQGDLPLVPIGHDVSRDVTTEQSREEQSREEAGRPASAQTREPAASQPLSEDREFEHAATAALGGGRVKGSFAPMLALVGDRERIVEMLRSTSAGRPKPIGSWGLAATIAAEGLSVGTTTPGQGARASPSPAVATVFVEVDTPEWRAWMAHREQSGTRGCPTISDPARPSRKGWRFPTLWPPETAVTRPDPILEPAA